MAEHVVLNSRALNVSFARDKGSGLCDVVLCNAMLRRPRDEFEGALRLAIVTIMIVMGANRCTFPFLSPAAARLQWCRWDTRPYRCLRGG